MEWEIELNKKITKYLFVGYVKSRTNPETKYKVECKDNEWSCECKGFCFRHNCNHIEDAKQLVIKKEGYKWI
jgi:hypothetical protein